MTQRQVYPPLRLLARDLDLGRGETVLARRLAFDLGPGEGLLLRGPNGAGKSTLLLTLAGLLPPIAGSVTLPGHGPDLGPALHYCGHRNAIRPRLTTAETLGFWADLNGPLGLAVPAALERVGLSRMADLDAGYLSAGQGRRLALARLLVTPRPLWLLDEPSAALDAAGHALLADLIGEHLARGGLAVIATHDDIAVPGVATFTLGGGA